MIFVMKLLTKRIITAFIISEAREVNRRGILVLVKGLLQKLQQCISKINDYVDDFAIETSIFDPHTLSSRRNQSLKFATVITSKTNLMLITGS